VADELDYVILPRLPVADGATGPDPGRPFALAWSTAFNDVAWWDGAKWVNNNPLATPVRNGLITAADYQKIQDFAAGAPGPQGEPGEPGPQGIQGEPGPQGLKGDTGAAGAAGAQGIQGLKGDTGLQGATGTQGPKGDPGAAGTQGIQGIQGPKGDTGLQGATGTQGPKGDTGLQGPAGAAGAAGAQGPKGDTGAAGAQGPAGADGSAVFTPAAIAHGATTPTAALYTPRFSTIENDVIAWNGTSWRIVGKGAASKLYALRFADDTQRFATQATGGELGVASGFGNITLVYLRRMPTTATILRSKINSTGWQQYLTTAGFYCRYHNGSALVDSTTMPVFPAMVGRLVFLVSRITATPGVMELSVDTLWAPTSPAMAGYLGQAVAECLGNHSAMAYPSIDADILAGVDFRGVPTRAQLDAYVLAARALGDLPATMNGATLTHRKSLREALAGTTVVAGQVAPASLPDTITLAAADTSTRGGSPTITEIDVATIDGRTTYGITGLSGTVGLQRAGGGVAMRGAVTGHWFAMRCILRTTSIYATEYLVDVSYGADGFRIARTTYSPEKLEIHCFGAVNVTAGSANIIAADRDVPILLLYTYDGTTHAVRNNRAIIISGTGSYVVPNTTCTMALLADRVLGSPALNTTIFEAAGGNVALTQGEIDAMLASFASNGTLVPAAGKTAFSVDITKDVVANGGAVNGVPATIADRTGSAPLSRIGTGLVLSRRTDRAWSVETTPIAHGYTPASGKFYKTASPLTDIGSSAFWAYVVFRPDSTALSASGNSIQMLLMSASGLPGPVLYTSGNNTVLTFAVVGAAATAVTSGNATISAADLGRMDVVLCVYTGSTMLIYRKRQLEVQTAGTITFATPSDSLYLGTENAGTPRYADRCTFFGAAAGQGVPTLAQYQALYDSIVAEDGAPQAMPGMTTRHLWKVSDAGGGVLPDTLVDTGTVPNNMTRFGVPTYSPNYSRAFAA